MTTASVQSPDTKNRILDAAERLFADKGFDATSLRMITAAAEVNLAAVNYHFQSKEALLQAVYARRAGPVNAKRLEMLSAYESSVETPAVEPILDALIRPLFEIGESRECVPRLMVRLLYLDASEASRMVFQQQFQQVLVRFQGALRRALPHLSDQELMLRMQFSVGALANTIATSSNSLALQQGKPDPARMAWIVRQLIHYIATGLRAPALEDSQCGS